MTESQSQLPLWMPIVFVLFWLLITVVLGLFSGWFRLQTRFPGDDEAPVLRLRMQSGSMYGINLNSILTLDACVSGLRVSLWKLFGPFQRPFQVPWDQIEAEPVTRFLEPKIRLHFGRPEAGRLTINLRAWERLKAASQGIAAPLSRATAKRLERGLFLQWLVATVMAGSIFSLIAYSEASRPDPGSLAFCFGFPAVAFGINQLIRYMIQLR